MFKLILIVPMILGCVLLSSTIINIPEDYVLIQWGIDAAADGDTVLVDPGTYEENLEIEEKNLVLTSYFLIFQDSSFIEQTIIDGDNDGSVVSFLGCDDPHTMICGFTLINGCGTFVPQVWCGGGIYILDSSITIDHNIITNNSAGQGGGIYCNESEVLITDNQIRGNTNGAYQTFWGAGLCIRFSYAEIRRNIISDNEGRIGGGGFFDGSSFIMEECIINNNSVYCGGGGALNIHNAESGIIMNCEISNNTTEFPSGSVGGGFYSTCSNLCLYNVLISNNLADEGAGFFCEDIGDVSFVNCTIVDNIADLDGGGLFCGNQNFAKPNVSLTDCIVWNNLPNQISQIWSDLSIQFCDLEGGEAGIFQGMGIFNWLDGNIDLDPNFVDQMQGDYRLTQASPCIDSGITDFTGFNIPETDLDGFERIWDGDENGEAIIDMGCYEYGANPNVGVHQNNIVANSANLYQNFPNPFNPATTISFSLQEAGLIELGIFNSKGQKVKSLLTGYQNSGNHSVNWNGVNEEGRVVSSGIYFYRLLVDGRQSSFRKCILLK